MLEYIESLSYWEFFFYVCTIVTLRYVLIAFPLYFVFWMWKPKGSQRYKIQPRDRIKPIPKTELLYSISTILVNGFFGMFLFWTYKQGWLKVYIGLETTWDFTYFVISIMLSMLIHDAYFYWAHRAMHTKWLFRKVHAVHHKSINPTPLSSYCFHPFEAFLEIFFLFPLLLVLPMHPYAIFTFLLLTFLFNVEGHTGIEFMPKWVWEVWITTPTHHNLHHQKFHCNYALYYRYWDEWFNTLYADTEKAFKDIRSRPRQE